MQGRTTKKRFTVDDIHRMDRAGIFTDERIELINGEVFLMGIGSRHAARVERARDLLSRLLIGRAAVRSQNPIFIDDHNLPQPDVVLARLRNDYYESHHPRTEDIFLVLEISDASIEHDEEVKSALYAIAGINEYWLEDISREIVLIFRHPVGDRYSNSLTAKRGDMISPLAFPDLQFKVEDLLG